MNYFLAVDGGGTKTKVLCANEKGEIVGEGLSGPTSLTVTNVGAASFSLREAIRQATLKLPPDFVVKKFVMGLAGMDTVLEKSAAEDSFKHILADFNVQTYEFMNDVFIALRSASDSNDAVAIIAGTGSNCFGINSQGQFAKTGGLDFLLTDEGSGYDIGLKVLKIAAKSYDGRAPKTILEQMVNSHFDTKTIPDLKEHIYNPPLSKTQIAALAVLASEALVQGDNAAKEIIDGAIDELFLMTKVVVESLGLQDKSTDMVFAGKVIQDEYIKDNLSKRLLEKFTKLKIVIPDKEPVYGALKIAMS